MLSSVRVKGVEVNKNFYMKRVNNLFKKIYDKDNIKLAIIKSSKGKTKNDDVMKLVDNMTYYVDKIYELLKNKAYISSKYRSFILYDSLNKKERIIYSQKYYPDQIIHYCLMNILEPILMRKMYLYSCGSIPGRGTFFGQKTICKWLGNDKKNTKYCLKMDIKKILSIN